MTRRRIGGACSGLGGVAAARLAALQRVALAGCIPLAGAPAAGTRLCQLLRLGRLRR